MPAGFLRFLADLILVVHFGIVLYIVVGQAAICIGWLARWRCVRNPWFRWTHLLAMGVVAAQALVGVICPLTLWENALRREAGDTGRYESTFVQHWIGEWLFFDWEPAVFTAIYLGFFALVALSWWAVPPDRKYSTTGRKPQPSEPDL
jgi:hypothetical protein